MVVHLSKYQLTDSAACFELDSAPVSVKQFECYLALETGVYPACILYEQTHASERASALNESCQVVGKLEIFHSRRENELTGENEIGVGSNGLVAYTAVKGAVL